MPAHEPAVGPRLGIDPTVCAGVGICAHVAPHLIPLDSWGYPLLPRRPLDRGEARRARAAVTACPRRALFLLTPAAR